MASGVLPLAVGDATRLLSYLGDETKSYIATMRLGSISDTQDAWGSIQPINDCLISDNEIEETIRTFKGVIDQIPPMYSAVHHEGQRLYELARQGVEVERTPRRVDIMELEILSIEILDRVQQIRFRVKCSRGTYVRTLCHDIGAQLGTGAYMSDLIRTHSGAFALETAGRLEDIIANGLKVENILSLDYPLSHLPAVYLADPSETRTIIHGGPIPWSAAAEDGPIRIYSSQKNLIGIGKIDEEGLGAILKPVRVLAGSSAECNT